jgi:hypothetical protein
MNKILTLLALTTVVSACATTETQTFKDDPLIRPGAKIELGTVTVPPDSEYEIDVAAMMNSALVESLAEHNIAWQGGPAADRFVLDVVIDNCSPSAVLGPDRVFYCGSYFYPSYYHEDGINSAISLSKRLLE